MTAPPADDAATSSSSPPPVQALLAAYSSLSVRALLAPLAEEGFTHRVLPASLGLPARDRAGFAAHAAGVFALFAAFAVEPLAVHDATGAGGVVVVRALMHGTLWAAQPPAGRPWRAECVLLLRLTPDRARIAAIDEFVDSAQALEMRRLAPREFAPAPSFSSPSSSSSSASAPKPALLSYASSALAGWLAPHGGPIIPSVVSAAAQLLAVCVAYQALTRSCAWLVRSEA